MLLELSIRDFAIIDHLTLTMGPGLTVLSGETGAGKSIIIDALGLLLGERASADMVRAGARQALVEGTFDLQAFPPDHPVRVALGEDELDDGSAVVTLAREVHASGRSVARINGRSSSLGFIQELAEHLLDIHGQSEHLSLLRSSTHLDLLDGFAGLGSERAALAAAYAELRRLRRELADLRQDERELARRADLLRFQVDEIARAQLREGEDEELERELSRLAHGERLAVLAESAYQALYAGSSRGAVEEPSALDLAGRASREVGEMARLDAGADAILERLGEASALLEEAGQQLRRYRDEIDLDPARLDEVQQRRELLVGLKRKYGQTVAEVLAFGQGAAEELAGLEGAEERAGELERRAAGLLAEIGALSGRLSQARQRAAGELSVRVQEALRDLRMGRVTFRVSLTRQPDPEGVGLSLDGQTDRFAFDARGIDRAEFFVQLNPGEPEKPLAKVASGGETARLMLALKSVLSTVDATPTLIFDEVDVGVGGRGGLPVGEKLWLLGRDHQVVCITHLAQVAALADQHYRIAKVEEGGRTITTAEPVVGSARVDELALMLGGLPLGDAHRAGARELLERAESLKQAAGDAACAGTHPVQGQIPLDSADVQ